MKVLQVSKCFFKLPDGFTGGVPEALRWMAEYFERIGNTSMGSVYETDLQGWKDFECTVDQGGRLSGIIGIVRYPDGARAEWEQVPVGSEELC